jgi:hypothetical protein
MLHSPVQELGPWCVLLHTIIFVNLNLPYNVLIFYTNRGSVSVTKVSCLVSLVSYDIEKSDTPWALLDIPVGTSGGYPIFSWTCKSPLK